MKKINYLKKKYNDEDYKKNRASELALLRK